MEKRYRNKIVVIIIIMIMELDTVDRGWSERWRIVPGLPDVPGENGRGAASLFC